MTSEFTYQLLADLGGDKGLRGFLSRPLGAGDVNLSSGMLEIRTLKLPSLRFPTVR